MTRAQRIFLSALYVTGIGLTAASFVWVMGYGFGWWR